MGLSIIIAGGRDFNIIDDKILIHEVSQEVTSEINSLNIKNQAVKIIEGGARGADNYGNVYAFMNGFECEQCKAEWERFGRRAGPIRNSVMESKANNLIAFWDGMSTGTRDMINKMTKAGKPVYVIYYKINTQTGKVELTHMRKRINYEIP